MILLSLLGEQPIPNLLPLWQFPRFNAVRFALTDTTRRVAEQIQRAVPLDPALARLTLLPAVHLPAYDIQKARLGISRTISAHLEAGETLCLNLTGGTKIMSLAALQAAFGTGVDLMYVSTEDNSFIFLRSDGTEYRREPISIAVDVGQYLRPHGLEISDNQAFNPDYRRFADPPPKEGDPLERLVYTRAVDSGLFDDVRRNLFIRRTDQQNPVTNELDVVVTRNGRLAVCSCKATQRIDPDDLYELSSLSRREFAGIYCGKVLATTAPVTDAALARARAWGIRLVYGDQLENIAFHLKMATE